MSNEDLSLKVQCVNAVFNVGAAVKEDSIFIEDLDTGTWRQLTAEESIKVDAKLLELKKDNASALAENECTARIYSQWPEVAQRNAALGVYTEEEKASCAEWISIHRDALTALLDRDDLIEIDVTDDQLWPEVASD